MLLTVVRPSILPARPFLVPHPGAGGVGRPGTQSPPVARRARRLPRRGRGPGHLDAHPEVDVIAVARASSPLPVRRRRAVVASDGGVRPSPAWPTWPDPAATRWQVVRTPDRERRGRSGAREPTSQRPLRILDALTGDPERRRVLDQLARRRGVASDPSPSKGWSRSWCGSPRPTRFVADANFGTSPRRRDAEGSPPSGPRPRSGGFGANFAENTVKHCARSPDPHVAVGVVNRGRSLSRPSTRSRWTDRGVQHQGRAVHGIAAEMRGRSRSPRVIGHPE